MKDTNFFRVMGALQILIAFINFYVALNVVQSGLGVLNLALGSICVVAGVFCTVIGAKLMGVLDQ